MLGCFTRGPMADWVSGIGSMLAVIVALAGYWLADGQRKKEANERRQNAAYQIGFKLSALASEARVILGDLNPLGKSDEELAAETNPMDVCGALQPKVGYHETSARDLSESEQNLLMSLREEDFLMDYSEAFARNQSIRAGILEYKIKREAISAKLPTPVATRGEIASFDLTKEDLLRIGPDLIAAASLVRSLRALSRINMDQLDDLGRRFTPMMTKHFPKLHIHRIIDTERPAAADGAS
jgi:hypothetical protein